MNSTPIDADLCPSQSFTPSPDESWGVDDLRVYAQNLDCEISQGERLLTPCYWNLGLALELARRQFSYRQWGKFLAGLKIDPTRASKARAIHRSFASADLVADISVKEAYQRRNRTKRFRIRPADSKSKASVADPSLGAVDPKPSAVDPVTIPVQFFVDICRNAELCQFKAESVTAEDAAIYLTALDDAIGELSKLRTLLSRKAASS